MSSFFRIPIRCSPLRLIAAAFFLMFLGLGAPEALAGPGHVAPIASHAASGDLDAGYHTGSSGTHHDYLHGDGAACCVACTALLMREGRQSAPAAAMQPVRLSSDAGRSYQLPDRLERPPRG